MEVLPTDGGIRPIKVTAPGLKVIPERLDTEQRVTLQRPFAGRKKQMAVGVVGQRFKSVVSVGLLEYRRHLQPSPRPLAVKGIFIHLIVLFPGNKDRVRGRAIANALNIPVGQAAGTETLIFQGRDTPLDAVNDDVQHEEPVFFRLVAHHGITLITQGRYPAIVARRQRLVKPLGLLCQRRQAAQHQQ